MRSEFSLLLALVAGEAIDRLAKPRRAGLASGPVAVVWRGGVIALIWLVAIGLTGRPLFALAATVVTISILVIISNVKKRHLKEPLVFSDVALLEHIVRHPQLFFIKRQWIGAFLAGGTILLAAIAAWMLLEPNSAGNAVPIVAWAGVTGIAVALTFPPLRRKLAASTAEMITDPNPAADVARIGLLVSMASYFVRWLAAPRNTSIAQPRAIGTSPFDVILIVQAEAFVDLRRLGYRDLRLPTFDRLKQRAVAAGLLEVPCQGGYTLRPESAVLSGIGFSDQGFDRFHPYLRPSRLLSAALPHLLAEAGWDTLFVHPFDGAFFRRRSAMPQLGFARFVDEQAFRGAQRAGPYVSDRSVAEFLLNVIEARPPGAAPLFAFAATMEAHEPYGAGRLADEADPVRQYVRHIENADRMLARLAEHLDATDSRTLLVFFGDHVPLLPALSDPFSDIRTDFLAVELGRQAKTAPTGLKISRPEHLHALVMERLLGRH